MDLSTSEYFILYRLPDETLEYLNLDDLNVLQEEADNLQIGETFTIPAVGDVTFIYSGNEEQVHARKRIMLQQTDDNDGETPSASESTNEQTPIHSTSDVENLQSQLYSMDQRVKHLEGHKNCRPSDRDIIKGAVVNINGVTRNVAELNRSEFDNLLALNRQRLGQFPTLPGITELQIMEELGPYLQNAFFSMRYGNFVSYLAGFLIEQDAFRISFLPPLGPHLRVSKPKPPKRVLNADFKKAFKYFALYFGGCILTLDFRPLWLDSLRSRYNTKADNLKHKENANYPTFEGLTPPFNNENAF